MNDEYYMNLALLEAKKAFHLGEVPVGAIIKKGNKVIAATHNIRESSKTALGHAEIMAIDDACRRLGGWRLMGCTLYVTLEPCVMCAGAIVNSRIERLVYGPKDPKAGAVHSLYNVLNDPRLNHQVNVTAGVLEEKSSKLLKEFFQKLRNSD